MTSARYALYLAPPPDTPLWRFGSRVLGYDAASRALIHGFAPAGLEQAAWSRMTQRPRVYGFHATLKAPFRLAASMSLDSLENELATFCRARRSFDLGPLVVNAFKNPDGSGFAALTHVHPSPELADLEQETVRVFDHFRAPMSQEEWRKRNPQTLSSRQREALERFGYPYTGPDYRFHMTLSGEVPDVANIADKLATAMANEMGAVHLKVDALVLFGQDHAGEPFHVMRRYDLLGVHAD